MSRMLLTLLLMTLTALSAADFGKNKVQYKQFDWSFIQTPHFDIYFYEGGDSTALFCSNVAEKAYNQISSVLDWRLRKRVSIIIYNSHNDFQQTNVTWEFMPEGVGGVTELFKNRVVIPFEGSYEQFRHVIHHELVHAMINDLIYGGSVQSILSGRVRVSIPLWMNEGLAEYLSLGWDTQADMILRDVAVHDRVPDIRELDNFMAYKGGQSVWRFLAERYGWQKVGDIFAQVKTVQSVEKGLENALGMDLKEFSEQWGKEVKRDYWPDIAGRVELDEFAEKLTDHEKLENYFNIAPSVSPDGGRLAILSDRSGYSDIFLLSLPEGKVVDRLVSGNRTPDFEELKWLQPGITWSPDGKKIAFAAKAGKADALFVVNVKSGKREKISLALDGVFAASWSPDGTQIAFVGNSGSASDLYLYRFSDKSLRPLTRDRFADAEPAWSPDGRTLAFVSDRGGHVAEPNGLAMSANEYGQSDLFTVDVESGEIRRLTATPFDENSPVWFRTAPVLAYTSDEAGIWNLVLRNLENGEARTVSNVLTGLFQLSLSADDQKLYFAGYSELGWDIYSVSNPLALKGTEVQASNYVAQAGPSVGRAVPVAERHEEWHEMPQVVYDTTAFSHYIFAPEYAHFNPTVPDSAAVPAAELTDSEILNPDGTYLKRRYQTKFTLDMVNGQAYFSNVFGYTGTTLFAFSDVMGDHQVFLGTELVINLENSDYYLAYSYLKRREDWGLSFIHTANFFGNEFDFIRLRNSSFDIAASLPFSRFQRVDAALTRHRILYERFERLPGENQYLRTESKRFTAPTVRINWVFDNTLWGFTSPRSGTRANLQYFDSFGLNEGVDFRTVLVDTRRYFPVFRRYSLSLRLSGGKSFGRDPQKFFLGGTDNWLVGRGETYGQRDSGRFNESELDIFDPDRSDYLKNLYFSIFALPVRGSRFVERVGNNLLLANAEFHFPFVNYLDIGFPLRVVFGNIQGVAFWDLGAAWDGKLDASPGLPHGKDYGDVIGGYGAGVRLNLGYFVLRFDAAWDMMRIGTTRPQYYLSLGTDL